MNINDLARQICCRKKDGGAPPWILFLGTGIALARIQKQIDQLLIDTGNVGSEEIYRLTNKQCSERFFRELEKKEHFSEYDQQMWLSKGLKDSEPSPGYQKLAELIEKGYFELVLTTNWDNLLDTCLEQSSLGKDKDYQIYIHGVDKDEKILKGLRKHRRQRIKVLKLNGDLIHKTFCATPRTTYQFSEKIEGLVSDILSTNDIVMVGYNSVADKHLQRYIKQNDHTLIYVNPDSSHTPLLKSDFGAFEQFTGKTGEFNHFINNLYNAIVGQEEECVQPKDSDVSTISLVNKPFIQRTENIIEKDETIVNSIYKSSKRKYYYDVVISFAGEDRETASELATSLKEKNIVVFYDKNEQGNLWGKNLYPHLQKVYRDLAQYCIVLISEYYVKKNYTRHELEQAQTRAFREDSEYILPVRVDDTELPGLPETVSCLDVREISIEEIAAMVLQKLQDKF